VVTCPAVPDRSIGSSVGPGTSNVSQLLDEALAALIERELERRWLDAHPDDDLPGEVAVDLSSVPWDDE
ncbi:MAG: hypothetical protein ACRD0U_19585, partial [Acidimicrobiales bacterium]